MKDCTDISTVAGPSIWNSAGVATSCAATEAITQPIPALVTVSDC